MTDLRNERFINPYTDFGFKRLFGTEMNKDLLISFLNSLFAAKHLDIADVQYLNGEQLGDGYGDRRAVFDVYCMTSDGGRFIVEMQKAEQAYFKDRSIYYSTFAIREQAPKGTWDYRLENVYTVGLLNFTLNEYPDDSYIHEIKLKDVVDNRVFYDKLTLMYLEMPKFRKTEDELETMMDKWMFVLHNLSRLMERPRALQDRVFKKLFEQAEIARYSETERRQYEESRKDMWDYFSTMKTAKDKGIKEGLEKGRAEGRAEGINTANRENARRMKAKGFAVEDIAEITGLSIEDIKTL